MKWDQVAEGRVVSLRLTPFGQSLSQEVNELQALVGEGLRGDRHSGARLSDVREAVLMSIGVGKEVPVANVRQFSAISVEELQAIGAAMQTRTPIPYGVLGENLVVEGVPDFSLLSPGTLLTFAKAADRKTVNRKAVLAVWGENLPCYVPEANILRHFRTAKAPFVPAQHFGVAAKKRRGLVGFVYCSGVIKLGDRVGVWQPV